MAGYIIYSLDWLGLQKLTSNPQPSQLTTLAEAIDEDYEPLLDDLAPDDIAHSWSLDRETHQKAIQAHLQRDDWYAGLSDDAKSIWHSALADACSQIPELLFRVESDGIYWDVIDIALRHLTATTDAKPALATFGTVPFRCGLHQPRAMEDWHPSHSMHSPDETAAIRKELNSVESEIDSSGNSDALRDYENELMPSLDRIVREERMLFVAVDT
jgi:hypothetical protein